MLSRLIFWAAGGHDWNAWRSAFGAFANRNVPAVFDEIDTDDTTK